MTIYSLARLTLFLEALVCLWLARVAWVEGAEQRIMMIRIIGPVLGCSAAGLIIYGLVSS